MTINKNKKFILGSLATLAVVSPLAMTISCGSSTTKDDSTTLNARLTKITNENWTSNNSKAEVITETTAEIKSWIGTKYSNLTPKGVAELTAALTTDLTKDAKTVTGKLNKASIYNLKVEVKNNFSTAQTFDGTIVKIDKKTLFEKKLNPIIDGTNKNILSKTDFSAIFTPLLKDATKNFTKDTLSSTFYGALRESVAKTFNKIYKTNSLTAQNIKEFNAQVAALSIFYNKTNLLTDNFTEKLGDKKSFSLHMHFGAQPLKIGHFSLSKYTNYSMEFSL